MGVLLFVTAVIVETAFAAFCLITKSNHIKVRGIVRIAAFLGFVFLAALSVIDWSMRYYPLAIWLFVLALQSTYGMIRKREEKKAFKSGRTVMKTIGMTALTFIVILPAILFPQYRPLQPTGEYQVATAAYTYVDPNHIETYTDTGENRKLNVEFWYPQNVGGTYPLIVFSHGGFGIKTSNESLFRELASHGYIVCSIDHTYQCLFTTDASGHTTWIDLGYMRECNKENARADRQQSYAFYQKWMGVRTGDINFVIDNILSQVTNADADAVYRLVDTTKIGVMGHSLGGSAALGIGRRRTDVGAVIALESPFLCDIEGVEGGEFIFNKEPYPIPVLNLYSDSAWSNLSNWPQYAENQSLLSGEKATGFNVHISGVGHFTLTDLSLASPILTRFLNRNASTVNSETCLKSINKVCLEFFDCYLKGKGKFAIDGMY